MTRTSHSHVRTGSGSASAETAAMQTRVFTAPHLARRVSLLGSENAFKIAPLVREIESRGQRVIKCHVGEPDFPLPSHIAREVKRQIDLGQTQYCDPQGIESVRAAIARDVGASRGLAITPDRVVIFPGAKPPIGFAQQIYCDPGDEVIYPSPGFPIYESFTRYLGAVPVPLHLHEERGFTCSAAELAPLITRRTKLIYLNFPSNPTGGVATREQLDGKLGTQLLFSGFVRIHLAGALGSSKAK